MNIAPGEALHCTTVCQRLKRKQDQYEICQTFLVLGHRPKSRLNTNLCYTFFFSNGRRMSYLGEFCCCHLLPPTKSKILRTKRQPRWPPLPSSPPTFDWGFPQMFTGSPCQPLYRAILYILSTELYYYTVMVLQLPHRVAHREAKFSCEAHFSSL